MRRVGAENGIKVLDRPFFHAYVQFKRRLDVEHRGVREPLPVALVVLRAITGQPGDMRQMPAHVDRVLTRAATDFEDRDRFAVPLAQDGQDRLLVSVAGGRLRRVGGAGGGGLLAPPGLAAAPCVAKGPLQCSLATNIPSTVSFNLFLTSDISLLNIL